MEEFQNVEKPVTYRVNVRVSQKIKNYFEAKSRDTGVSQSSLMALALDEYIDQKIMLEFTQKLDQYTNNDK